MYNTTTTKQNVHRCSENKTHSKENSHKCNTNATNNIFKTLKQKKSKITYHTYLRLFSVSQVCRCPHRSLNSSSAYSSLLDGHLFAQYQPLPMFALLCLCLLALFFQLSRYLCFLSTKDTTIYSNTVLEINSFSFPMSMQF